MSRNFQIEMTENARSEPKTWSSVVNIGYLSALGQLNLYMVVPHCGVFDIEMDFVADEMAGAMRLTWHAQHESRGPKSDLYRHQQLLLLRSILDYIFTKILWQYPTSHLSL